MSKLLIVDDEPRVLRALSAALALCEEYDISTSTSARDARLLFKQEGPFDAIITDQLMSSEKGHELLEWCHKHQPECQRIMLTGLPVSKELQADLSVAGDVTIFTKPWNVDKIASVLKPSNNDVTPNHAGPTDKTVLSSEEQDHRSLIIFERDGNYREIFSQLQGIYYEQVLHISDFGAFINGTKIQEMTSVAELVFDMDDGELSKNIAQLQAVCHILKPKCVLVTASPRVALSLTDLELGNTQFDTLVKPYSRTRLSQKLKLDQI